MSNQGTQTTRSRSEDTEHLEGVETGAGCTEIWERLSEHREEATSSTPE